MVKESCPEKGLELAPREGLDARKDGPSCKCQKQEGSEVHPDQAAGLEYEEPGVPGWGVWGLGASLRIARWLTREGLRE